MVYREMFSLLTFFLDIQLLGPLFRSSEVVELTESETEYVVRCVKHCYAKHAVLQFDCLNTLNDQLLENVRVQLDPSEGMVNRMFSSNINV